MILNLTQHQATTEQQAQGVVDLPDSQRKELQKLLTIEALPDKGEIDNRAEEIASMAIAFDMERDQGPISAMIGGAPFLMGALEWALDRVSIQPLYAFSVRESVDQTQPDGSVRKVAVFRHCGFVEV